MLYKVNLAMDTAIVWYVGRLFGCRRTRHIGFLESLPLSIARIYLPPSPTSLNGYFLVYPLLRGRTCPRHSAPLTRASSCKPSTTTFVQLVLFVLFSQATVLSSIALVFSFSPFKRSVRTPPSSFSERRLILVFLIGSQWARYRSSHLGSVVHVLNTASNPSLVFFSYSLERSRPGPT
ncbi:hypothetical protein E1B28_009699 [Marasmius oreades]|uniref:Uncharacterized protein n=1 Tax=Marasmius oreades TaxID=181124 RepID=A0A9P7RVL0_9AGAR|nr:uncharacterized protein E1B28_009699 [Marasmius oreades]KAG7090594.1 hypothetical protein E1B28_009699 [Marasmius oreades]